MKNIFRNCIGFLAGCVSLAILMQPILLRADGEVLMGEQETPIGSGVWVNPLPEISIHFPQVSRQGITTAVRETPTETFPNIDFGAPAYVYRVSTTAQTGGPITVCVSFNMERFVVPNGEVRLWQIDGNEATMRTHTYGWTYACGKTDHLSTFVAAQNFGLNPITFSRAAAGNTQTPLEITSPSASAGFGETGFLTGQTTHNSLLRFFSASGNAVLTIVNGSVPTTGARITLNGKLVGNGSLFKKQQNGLSAPVALLPGTNTLEVSVDGGPGSSFTLSIQRAP